MNNNKTNLTKSTMNYYNLPHDIFNLIQSFVVDDKVEHRRKLKKTLGQFRKSRRIIRDRFNLMSHIFENQHICFRKDLSWDYRCNECHQDKGVIDIPRLLKTCQQELKYDHNYMSNLKDDEDTTYEEYLGIHGILKRYMPL